MNRKAVSEIQTTHFLHMGRTVYVKSSQWGQHNDSVGEATWDKPDHLGLIPGTQMVGREANVTRYPLISWRTRHMCTHACTSTHIHKQILRYKQIHKKLGTKDWVSISSQIWEEFPCQSILIETNEINGYLPYVLHKISEGTQFEIRRRLLRFLKALCNKLHVATVNIEGAWNADLKRQ